VCCKPCGDPLCCFVWLFVWFDCTMTGLVCWFALECMLRSRGFVCERHSCFRFSLMPTGFVFWLGIDLWPGLLGWRDLDGRNLGSG